MEAQSTTPRPKQFGTWTEQTSSSGKRYYYDSSTNVSQWDKPTEWKQAEKLLITPSSMMKNGNNSGQTPTEKVSPTSSTAPKIVHMAASSSHRQPVSSTFSSAQRPSNSQSSFSSTQQQVKPDSSTSINKLASSSTPNSASPSYAATKRPRLDEDVAQAKMASSPLTSMSGRSKPMVLSSQQQQQQVSSTTGGCTSNQNEIHHQRGDERDYRTTSGSITASQFNQQQQTPLSTSSINKKRPLPSSSTERINSSSTNRDHPPQLKSPTKPSSFNTMNPKGGQTTSTPQPTPRPRPLNSINTSSLSLAALKDPKHYGSGMPMNNGKALTPTATMTDVKPEKPSTPAEGFCEDKYQKYWRPEMTACRRALGTDAFLNDIRKCADRLTKQTTSIFALDRDIHSIRTLDQTALLRTRLLQQRLGAVRQRIQELDS